MPHTWTLFHCQNSSLWSQCSDRTSQVDSVQGEQLHPTQITETIPLKCVIGRGKLSHIIKLKNIGMGKELIGDALLENSEIERRVPHTNKAENSHSMMFLIHRQNMIYSLIGNLSS